MSKTPARGHKVEQHHSEGRKESTTYSPYREKAEMVQEILEKSDISEINQEVKRKKHVWLPGRLHIEGRLNEKAAASTRA